MWRNLRISNDDKSGEDCKLYSAELPRQHQDVQTSCNSRNIQVSHEWKRPSLSICLPTLGKMPETSFHGSRVLQNWMILQIHLLYSVDSHFKIAQPSGNLKLTAGKPARLYWRHLFCFWRIIHLAIRCKRRHLGYFHWPTVFH